MRRLFGLLFALMLLAGIALGIVLPQAAERVAGYEIGSWELYAPAQGYRSAQLDLAPADAPVFLTVRLRTLGPIRAGDRGAVLDLTVSHDGAVVLRDSLDFSQPGTSESPQDGILLHEARVGPLERVDGRYLIQAAAGPAGIDNVQSVEIVANAGAFDVDPRAEPAGYLLVAVAFIGLVLTFRRKREPATPAAPKWGRDGGGT